MNTKIKSTISFIAGMVSGVLLTALVTYTYFFKPLAENEYRVAVSEARLNVTNLKNLRTTNTDKAIDWMEVDLDNNIWTAGLYEKNGSNIPKDQDMLDAWAYILKYRNMYPSLHTNEEMLKDLSEILKSHEQSNP